MDFTFSVLESHVEYGEPTKRTTNLHGSSARVDCRGFQPTAESPRKGGLLPAISSRNSPENKANVTIVINAWERRRLSPGTDPARTPTKHAPINVVDARRDLPLMLLGPFLNVHVHAPTSAQIERADVNLAADELEREAVTGDKETSLSRAGDRSPGALKVVEVGAHGGWGRGEGRKGWHGEAPIKIHRLLGKWKLPANANRGEGLPKPVRL
jgi:hypothetical protein